MVILAQTNPVYQPAMRIIAAITNNYPAQVTTTFAHNYQTGEVLRLNIPTGFGMVQANHTYGSIIVISPISFTIDIDTTTFDPFAIPPINPGHFYTQAQVTPIGEQNNMLTAAARNVL